MMSDDELRSLEDELRAHRPSDPTPGLRARISREISERAARDLHRVRRRSWLAAAAALLALVAFFSAAFLMPRPGAHEPAPQPRDMTAWTYTMAGRDSTDALCRLLDRQAAARSRPGPITGSSIEIAWTHSTETKR